MDPAEFIEAEEKWADFLAARDGHPIVGITSEMLAGIQHPVASRRIGCAMPHADMRAAALLPGVLRQQLRRQERRAAHARRDPRAREKPGELQGVHGRDQPRGLQGTRHHVPADVAQGRREPAGEGQAAGRV
eukprot:185286-Rhodomonas_salina.1